MPRARVMIWFRSANSHTGPQLHRCIIRGRTDGSIRLRANLLQKPLASGGASTDDDALNFTMHLHPDVAPRLVVGVIRPDTLFSDGWNAINVFVVLEGR